MTHNHDPGAGTFWVIVLLLWFYILPGMIAIIRNHHNCVAIAVLNLLLGWTFIGWAIALVWACTATPGPNK